MAAIMTEPYRIREAAIWAQARTDYLSGLSAEAVCRRHDLGLSVNRRLKGTPYRRAIGTPF